MSAEALREQIRAQVRTAVGAAKAPAADASIAAAERIEGGRRDRREAVDRILLDA